MRAFYRSSHLRISRRLVSLGTLAVGIVLGFLLLSAFAHVAQTGLWSRLAGYVTGRSTSIDASSTAVVEKIRQLSRLETVVYSLDTVVEGNESNPVLPDALAGDKLLMIVHGQTIAGIDMSKLQADSVQITEGSGGRTIRLSLPPSQVFVTSIDVNKTRVYARDTGLLVKADPNLETQVLKNAQAQLQQAALSDGILDAANKNARATVTAMLGGLGFEHVDIR